MAGVMARAREMGAELADDWLDLVYSEIFDVLGQSVEMIPHVPWLLDELDKADIIYAIGSNGPMRKMEVTLGRTGLWDRFEGRVFSSYDCEVPKPAPDVYLKASRLAGIDPSDCVVIEDSATGARAAVAGKMPCFGYCAETPVDLMTPHCVATFDDMRALPKLLGL
jgi:HAD superfamily hydrolase (TIGR01509 family)